MSGLCFSIILTVLNHDRGFMLFKILQWDDFMKDLEPKVNKVKWIDRIIVYCIIFALIIGGVLFIFQATLRIFGIFWG